MVAFKAPSPRFFPAWLPKNGEEIFFGVADGGTDFIFFEFCEDGLEAHNGDCFGVAAVAEAGGEERLSEESLFLVHLFNCQSFAFSRNEVPVGSFGGDKVELDFGLLFGV